MVWCPMILAQYVMLRAFLGRPIPQAERERIMRHFERTRRSDGGWGLHSEAPSYVFVTALGYVALRLLGVPPDAPLAANARRWLHAQPSGVLGIPSWGKFWLAMAGSTTTPASTRARRRYFFCPAIAGPPRPTLLPHPLHLSRNELPLRHALSRRPRADHGANCARTLPDVIRNDRFTRIATTSRRATSRPAGPALRVIWNTMTAFERLVPRYRACVRCGGTQ